MKRAALAATLTLITLATLLGACSSTPYLDSRREAGKKDPVGPSRPNLVAICYSRFAVDKADVQKLANSECAKVGKTATFNHEDGWDCTFNSPTRAYYSCVAKP